MNRLIPSEYIIAKFYELAGFPKFKRGSGNYNGCCPSCREGKSWGKKRRLFYLPEKDLICCHNCNINWNPINWIMEQSGLSFHQVMEESKEYDFANFEVEDTKFVRPESDTLPEDSINLFDKQQLTFYADNQVVKDARAFIKKRRLDTAINRPDALYISLKDFIHKNRVVIPFYDYKGKIVWYQSRAIYKKDEIDRPKYMSKLNAERGVFGLNKINPQLDYLFIFEGPIDSMFVKNGLAMGGVVMSDLQHEQMNRFRLHQKIWVLDNEVKENKDVKYQVNKLLEHGERVFFWPRKYKGIKDINELCVKVGRDKIRPEFFIENSYSELEGLTKLSDLG
jgi:hypothetical protein